MKKKWLWAIALFFVTIGIWVAVTPSYEDRLLSAAGLDRHQDYQVLWTEHTVTGIDYSTFVCLSISDVESNRFWVGLEELRSNEAAILDVGMGYPPADDCIGPPAKMLVLHDLWRDGVPYVWHFLLLDVVGQRLMLVTGKM